MQVATHTLCFQTESHGSLKKECVGGCIGDISLKLDALGYISVAQSSGISSTTFIRNAP